MSETRKSNLLGKITILSVVCCLMTVGLCVNTAAALPGLGTQQKPWLIESQEDFDEFAADANYWAGYTRLETNVNLAGRTYSTAVIAPDTNNAPCSGFNGTAFTGFFDGNDHKITGLTIDDGGAGHGFLGLFGFVDDGEIRNLGLEGGSVSGSYRVGGLVGANGDWYNPGGAITNCYSTGDVHAVWYVGGLVGFNRVDDSISNCYSTGSVSGEKYIGGLVGHNGWYSSISTCYSTSDVSGNTAIGGLVGWNDGSVSNCCSAGSVIGTEWYAGGLVGAIEEGSVSNCYSTADVTGNDGVGGLVGDNTGGSVSNCYSTGDVRGNVSVGGLVGRNYYSSVSNCLWDTDTQTHNVNQSIGFNKGTVTNVDGLPTAQMQTKSTFTEAGWDFVGETVNGIEDIWKICEGEDYPRLSWEKYGGGTGESNNPYLIYTSCQMNAISNTISADYNDRNKHFKLMADIDLSAYTGTSFNIIGNFTGIFDGNGKKIFNFTYTSNEESYIGLFVDIEGENAVIKDLGLIAPDVEAGAGGFVGSLVAYLENGSVSNCYVEGGSVAGDRYIGGLVGYSYDGDIADCYAKGSVFGDRYVGGLVGCNDNSIVDCYTSGNVTGSNDSFFVGGLCGKSTGPDHGTVQSSIQNCYSTATVTGYGSAGGLVGHSGAIVTGCYSSGSVSGHYYIGGLIGRNGGRGSIKNCYSTGSVVGEQSLGGLVGGNDGTVFASFWDVETSGKTTSGGGSGLTTAEMQMAITFVCWGYEPLWTIDEGVDYPRLVWENKPGELITVPSHLYGGGTGEPEDPYLIYTAQQLNQIGLNQCHLDKHFKLMADVDLGGFTGTSFNIIGIDNRNPFRGVFDGNGKKIFNFIYTSTDKSNIALFGCIVTPNAEVRNLGLIDPNVDAGTASNVGPLVGELRFGNITNCYVEGGSVDGRRYVGGLVGGKDLGTISNSYSTCIVSGDWYLGGLVGYQFLGTISNCYSTGSVSGDEVVGGLVGSDNKGTIANSYSTCIVSGDQYVGGLVGRDSKSTISNSYVTGSVTGNGYVGGLVGRNWEGTITNCYSTAGVAGVEHVGGLVGSSEGTVSASFWDIDTSGQDWSAGGRGLPTYHMQMQINFLDAGWDFLGETVNGIEDIWFIPQQDYPHLWWKEMQVPMKLTPRKLNCRSQGTWVKAHLTLPQGFTVEDVDSNKPAVLHSFGLESAPLYVFVNKNGRVQIEAAFERQQVCSLAGDWPDELTVAGFLTDGSIFLGTSNVKINHPGLKVIEELAWYWLNEDCAHPDFCNQIDMNRDSLVNLLDYALLMNIEVEFVTDE